MRVRAVGGAIATALVVAAATATGVTAATGTGPDGRYRQFGDAGGFLNVVAPGQAGHINAQDYDQLKKAIAANDPTGFPPHYADQRALYNDLVFHSPGLAQADLTKYFKDASFGVKPDDIDRVYHPHADVTIIRDKSFGVPHIYGTTRYATIFAEGYATAEDRLVFMDVLRRKGRGTLSELAGANVIQQDKSTVEAAPYTEADLEHQIDDIRKGPDGRAAVEDLNAYTDGVNAYLDAIKKDPSLLPLEYKLLGKQPDPWKVTDEVAIASNVGGIFGKGGGREVDNLCGIKSIAQRTGDAAQARRIFDDLKFANDPAAPTTSHQRAPYNTTLGRVDRKSQPDLDCASLHPAGGAAEPTTANAGLGSGSLVSLGPAFDALLAGLSPSDGPKGTSSAILVSGDHTATGRPIAVFGPQVGYNVPSLLVEKDVHGPGIDARGVGFVGVDFYVLLGRGRDYAWSATSSGADNVDQWVLKLCDPAGGPPTTTSTGYLHDGKCTKLDAFDHAVDTTSGTTKQHVTWHVERAPDYGPIVKRGKLTDGTPIAIAVQRSTYGGELASAIGFRDLNDPDFMKSGYDAFRKATGEHIGYTFNWFYVDATTIGYEHSCKCPVRAKGVEPDLPTWGTGEWDWKGFIKMGQQPHEVNPEQGYITSWNNKQAPGFRVADDKFSDGPVHRVQILNKRLDAAMTSKKKLTRADVVNTMEDAATVDLRGQEVLPTLLKALGTTPPPGTSDRVLAMREKLETWAGRGAHRKAKDPAAKVEDDGGAVAIMDAWWKTLPDAVFGDGSGTPIEALGLIQDDSPMGHSGSSFLEGEYGAVQQDLRQVLGEKMPGAWATPYCGRTPGGGAPTLEQCRSVLWQSLATAATNLEAEFHTPDVEQWQRKVADDEIRFDTLVADILPMNWQNRPTFQQVVQLESSGQAHTSTGGGGGSSSNNNRGTLLVVLAVALVIALVVVYSVRRRTRLRPRN